MIEIEEAIEHVAHHAHRLDAVTCPLERMPGHLLAEDVFSDVDSPPFDKSMMDGFAVRSSDIDNGHRDFKIVGRILAGANFDKTLESGQAVQIMTGAPVPVGADAVVMVEQTEESNDVVSINAERVAARQNILDRALSMAAGKVVMKRGALVRNEDIGLLAEAGVTECQVIRRPGIAVIATGNELVDARSKPVGNQIRNSNGPMLSSLARDHCSTVQDLGIAGDDCNQLTLKINKGLQGDVLVLSGGVSAGVADLVPDMLKNAGVQPVFHRVKIKPGKPVWFGVLSRDERHTLVFGLPGNPVSSMICFHVFVAPALRRLAGRDGQANYFDGTLAMDHSQRPGRTTYWPARRDQTVRGYEITPLNWKGSADLKTLGEANCFAVFPGHRDAFTAGESIQVFAMSDT